MKLLSCSPRRPISAAALTLGLTLTLTLTLALAPAVTSAATASPQVPAAKAPAPHLVGLQRIQAASVPPVSTRSATTARPPSSTCTGPPGPTPPPTRACQFYTHSCVPTCAKGTVTLYPVNVSAWRVRSGDYTRFSYSFTHGVPSGFGRSWTIDYNGRWSGRVV